MAEYCIYSDNGVNCEASGISDKLVKDCPYLNAIGEIAKLSANNILEESAGLYSKYTVINNWTGLEVYDCFVLKPMKDEAARLALLYYADICDNEALKNDIKAWLNSN